jgi:hypothetical protein
MQEKWISEPAFACGKKRWRKALRFSALLHSYGTSVDAKYTAALRVAIQKLAGQSVM